MMIVGDSLSKSVSQDKLSENDLWINPEYSGFQGLNSEINFKELFSLF